MRPTLRALPLALLGLASAALGATAPHPAMLHIQAFSDLIAAETCLHRGYAYMVRIGPHDVLCLRSAAGVEKQAVRAQAVIDAAVRAVRGPRAK